MVCVVLRSKVRDEGDGGVTTYCVGEYISGDGMVRRYEPYSDPNEVVTQYYGDDVWVVTVWERFPHQRIVTGSK